MRLESLSACDVPYHTYTLHPVARSPLSVLAPGPGAGHTFTYHTPRILIHSPHKREATRITGQARAHTSHNARPRHRGKAKGVVLASGRHRPTGHTQSQTHGDSQDVHIRPSKKRTPAAAARRAPGAAQANAHMTQERPVRSNSNAPRGAQPIATLIVGRCGARGPVGAVCAHI